MTTIAVNTIHAGDPRDPNSAYRQLNHQVISNQGSWEGKNLTWQDFSVDPNLMGGLTTTGELQIGDPSKHTGGRIGIGDGIYIGDYPPLIGDRTAPQQPWTLPWIEPLPWIDPTYIPQPNSNSYIMLTPPLWRVRNKLDCLEISTDLPGVKPQDLDVALEGRLLKVTARRADTGESISRSQYVMETFEIESALAVLEEGVLTITFKPEPKKSPRTIPVVVKR